MKKILIISILMMILLVQNTLGQHLQYDIIWFGKIGNLHIDKKINSDSVIIETRSEVRVPFYRLRWITTSAAINGLLVKSNYRQLINKDKKEFTDIHLMPDRQWHLSRGSQKADSSFVLHPCFYVSQLYYKEPSGEKFIFSERFCTHLEILDLGAGHYRLLLPDDNYCDYFYEEGVCILVEAKNGSKTIKMKLSSNS